MPYYFALLFMFSHVSLSYETEVVWRNRPLLTWSDFRGVPDNTSPYDAQANSGVKYSYSITMQNGKSTVIFDVHSFFDSQMSWSKTEKQNDFLLKHEQLHFDISELHARKLKKAFSIYAFSKSPQKEVEKIFARINKERQVMQNKYDEETNHSKNKEMQAKWQILIERELTSLQEYR